MQSVGARPVWTWVRFATEREGRARGYNWATLSLEDINTGTWTSVKDGHEFRGTLTLE
jgi:hypothetical protein